MSVIIRLQNLPWSANALDIRQYFHGLSIPEGGVHIVGGELGDAFIAFSTDEDARQAFTRNNGKIKEIQITLMLSSRTEMQRVIEQARSQSYAAFMQTAAPTVVPMPAVVPAIVPVTTETKRDSKEKSEKRDGRRRSRSKSRDRRDRSRDRRRHRRSRSRSRSRDRKSRRRERSRSRGRSPSKERKSKDHRKRSEEPTSNATKKPLSEIWGKKSIDISLSNSQPSPRLLGNFAIGLNQGKRSVENVNVGLHLQQQNGGPFNNNSNNNGRNSKDNSWSAPINFESNFQNNRNTNFRDRDDGNDQFQNRFQKNNIPNRGPNNRHENDNCSIALEPFYGGYGDVRRFFQGMFISSMGIKFINDLSGRSTGVVYVRFSNRKFKEEALSMNGELLNGITVTISHISDEEFEEATDRYNPRNNDNEIHDDNNSSMSFKSRNITKYFNTTDLKNFSCLTIDDLPTYCKEQDILHIFSQHPLVALILTNKKRGGYIAYVKFSSSDVAKQALEEKAHHIVGGKPVTVKPCKDEEFDDINKKHEVNINSTKSEDLGTDCLSVSGLPEKINDKDIADFFSDIGVIPTKIHLMSNNLGFTGQAYCEFANNEETSRAARKNDTSLGNVTITVVPIKRDEMETVLGTTLPAPDPVTIQDLVQTNEPEEKPFPRRPGGLGLGLGHLPNFISPSNIGRPSFPSRNFDMRGGAPRFGPRGFGGPRSRFGPPPKDVFEDVPPGCTIFMKNVPYKANTNDILNFFDGFNHTNNVSRRYNPNNTPSDEAKIIFFEPDEASRAMRDLQKAKIWDRQIFLRQE